MSIPTAIQQTIYDHYQAADWCIVTLNEFNRIIQFNPKAEADLGISNKSEDIKSIFALMACESLDEDFFIPFYNHSGKVFDVHFNIDQQNKHKYLILVPVDLVHKQVQYKQQSAHEQVIENLRLQYLFATLEVAHDELKEANTAKSFYISALSHEMGNPLNVIKGYNQLLQDGSVAPEQAASIIDRNVNKMQRIISQSIDYDMEQTKQQRLLFKPAELINEQFNDFRIQANNKNLKLFNLVDDSIALTANKSKWSQIFTNLISNAIKYTESGHVTISSEVTNDQLHIDVADTGCGMSEVFQKQLFTAWTREQKSLAQGHGIGLVISNMLAEQVDADLKLLTSNPKGSCFRFSVGYEHKKTSLRILLVDDDPDCLCLFEYYLTQVGHQVITAQSVSGLKQQLQKHTVDTIVTDLNLSDGQVHHCYQELKASVNHVIIMTANPAPQILKKLNSLGVETVLSKPLSQEQLVNSIS